MTPLIHPQLYTTTRASGRSLFQLLFGVNVTKPEDSPFFHFHFPGALGTATASSTREHPLPESIVESFENCWDENPFNYRLSFGPRALSQEGILDMAVLSKTLLDICEGYALTVVRGNQETLVSAGMYQQEKEVYDRNMLTVRKPFISHMEDPDLNPFASVYEGVIPLQQVNYRNGPLDIQ